MIQKIIFFFEMRSFGVCAWWARKLGISSSKVRLGFVYSSFIALGSPLLLYLIIKNHAFVDGNKRIGAACFLLFLMRNNLLLSANGVLFISNDALASITLFVAASKPEEMETVKGLVISVLNRRNS